MSLDLAYSVNWVLPNNKTRPRTISRSGDKGEDPLALLVRVSVTQFKLSLAVLTDWLLARTVKMLSTLVTVNSRLLTKLWCSHLASFVVPVLS